MSYRERLIANANDFDTIVTEILVENATLHLQIDNLCTELAATNATLKLADKEIDMFRVSERKFKETSDALYACKQKVCELQSQVDRFMSDSLAQKSTSNK